MKSLTVSLLALLLALFPVLSQETSDSETSKNSEKEETQALPLQIGMLIEYFELDHREANRLLREFAPRACQVDELRTILGELMGKGEATLVETVWLRSLSGQRTLTQSVEEHIYATEWDPAEIPNVLGAVIPPKPPGEPQQTGNNPPQLTPFLGKGPAIHITSATPTAFQTENLGVTVEVDPVVSRNEKIVYVNISPKRVQKLENRYYTRPEATEPSWGSEHIHMPEFYEMNIQTNFKSIPGHYSLLAFHAPHDQPDRRILCLLKVDLLK